MADDKDIYSEEGREELVDNDEISPGEEGFMEGAEGDGQGAKCRKCGKILGDDLVEKRVGKELCRFCSDECAEEYDKKEEKD
ncbi:MAG: hypothetical protein KKC75_07050 [Nanoarchaeota archaeon]|nr:hypothetical protein [Nanoarchaeota archaeon]MBU1005314.1 hypothetical protein [Nanoarchaeota archaeon]